MASAASIDDEPRHCCVRCNRSQGYDQFILRKKGQGWRGEDGVNRHSYCKECERKRMKDYLTTPEGRKARDDYNHRYYAENKDDPEFQRKRKEYRESERGRTLTEKRKERERRRVAGSKKRQEKKKEIQRLAAWESRRRMGQREIGPRVPLAVNDHDPYLPVEPLRDFIESQQQHYETAREMAIRFGWTERHLERVRAGEQRSIQLTSVDRLLTHLGVPLWEVYPSLYPGLDTSFLKEAFA